jgi:membrane protein implicated in regulation of membrane protease activity
MTFSVAVLWWIAAGIAVAVELATGTFYLLMIALGLAAGAVAAHLGIAGAWQVVVAALIGGGATALWHWNRMRRPQSEPVARNRDAHLDVGERVSVAAWGADRTARVTYRGSMWTARLAPDANAAQPGEHIVTAVEGNWLVLAPIGGH